VSANLTDSLLGTEAFTRQLKAAGWSATAVASAEQPASVIRVRGRSVAEVRLRLGGATWGLFPATGGSTVRLGPIPVYLSRSFPVQAHFLVPVDPAGLLEEFDARLTVTRGGILWMGEVEQVDWKGGLLAEELTRDRQGWLDAARCLKLGERLFVKPDADERCVRIVHQSKLTGRFSLVSSEVLSAQRHLPEKDLLDGIERMGDAIRAMARPRKCRKPAAKKLSRARGSRGRSS
jgi:hypothetical protein